jgi:hypothetical protein
VLAQLALQARALCGLGQEAREIEMRTWRPRAHAHLEIQDAALGAPPQSIAPAQMGEPVREQADSHRGLVRPALERSNNLPIEAPA